MGNGEGGRTGRFRGRQFAQSVHNVREAAVLLPHDLVVGIHPKRGGITAVANQKRVGPSVHPSAYSADLGDFASLDDGEEGPLGSTSKIDQLAKYRKLLNRSTLRFGRAHVLAKGKADGRGCFQPCRRIVPVSRSKVGGNRVQVGCAPVALVLGVVIHPPWLRAVTWRNAGCLGCQGEDRGRFTGRVQRSNGPVTVRSSRETSTPGRRSCLDQTINFGNFECARNRRKCQASS